MRKISAVLIEENIELFNDLVSKYKKLLEVLDFELNASHASGEKDAIEIIESSIGINRITLVISDIVMGTTRERRGLLWIKNLKLKYPDILFIGNSAKLIAYRDTATKLPTFDIYIDKSLLSRNADDYLTSIQKDFLLKYKQNVSVTISEKSKIPEKFFAKGHEDRELNSLVGQVLFSGHSIDSLMEFEEVVLTPLTGGYSGSIVFKMDIYYANKKLKAIPSVLKISIDEYADEEASNYKKYVKWVLPNKTRVELLGVGKSSRFGAICYSFILSSPSAFDNLTSFLNNEKFEEVDKLINKIFLPSSMPWYSNKLCLHEDDSSLSTYYLKECFKSDEECFKATEIYMEKAQEIFKAKVGVNNSLEISELDITIQEPNVVLFNHGVDKLNTTICHGDLNSNNIMLDANGSFVFIDFQNTGRQYIFSDFISFEQSIRLHYGDNFDLENMFSYEQTLANEDIYACDFSVDNMPEMYRLIYTLRKEAKRNFPDESFNNYLYALTVFSLRLLRIDDFFPFQYKRILVQLFHGLTVRYH